MTAAAVGVALLSAFCFALASVLQQKAASEVPDGSGQGAGFLRRLLLRPLWLAGFATDSIGYVLQAIALAIGALIVVQPLLVATLLFALPLGIVLTGRKVYPSDWGWALVLTASLAAFMDIGNPAAGVDVAPFEQWAVAFAVSGVVSVAAVVAGLRSRGGSRAFMLAIAAGVLFGLSSALTKSVMDAFDDGIANAIGPLLTSWETYALAIVITGGFYLQQVAYQAGNLKQALPAVIILDPVVSVAIGITVLDEALRPDGTIGWLVIGASLVAMTAATIQLSRSSAIHEESLGAA